MIVLFIGKLPENDPPVEFQKVEFLADSKVDADAPVNPGQG